jgi:hypothetical protein
MEGCTFAIVIVLIALFIYYITMNNIENADFTRVSSSPRYPLSYIHGVTIGRKVFDPSYHDPAIYRTPKQYLGPMS